MRLRPQTFRTKLLVLFVLVVAVAQVSTWLIVSRFHRAHARALIEEELQRAAWAFNRVIAERNSLLTAVALNAARDYPTKQLFTRDDAATLGSALLSTKIASATDIVSALSLEGRLLASTSPVAADGDIYAHLIAQADADPGPRPTAAGYGYLDGQLYSLVVAPVHAPDIIAWLMIGFKIDAQFVRALKEQTGIEVTFLDHRGGMLATTLPVTTAVQLTSALRDVSAAPGSVAVKLGRETALVAMRQLSAGRDRSAILALQYSLDDKLAPARRVERWLLGATGAALLLALLLSRAFARNLSRPIVALVDHARRIGAGDYSVRQVSYRRDELGRLAAAFDQMAQGLAERDRVRDLLDKNVSPEIAARLVREGAALGGEEREVTILFADLRGFTTMSETFPPQPLLTLLNRYLDRMSLEIERQGGVIDKFIGDGIMALFGAPVPQSDAADRALVAALAMERALVVLNSELTEEASAAPFVSPAHGLSIGIGINTARVVAGNIGSHRRLNYSVIGDGVNVAARLQALTRTPEYCANIITSSTTVAAVREPQRFSFRPLGPVHVKGRAEPVEITAVSSPGDFESSRTQDHSDVNVKT